MSEQLCRSCERPVRWAVTKNGKNMPLDPQPDMAGNIRLTGTTATSDTGRRGPQCEVTDPGLFDPDEARYLSHFATCPNNGERR